MATCGIPCAIPTAKLVINSPNLVPTKGNRFIRLRIASVIANIPPAPTPAKRANPVANNATPAPAAKQPIPRRAIDPANIAKPGAIATAATPATPSISNEPASIANPTATCPQLRLDIAIN